MGELTGQLRDVAIRHVNGWTYQQIADDLGIKRGSARRLVGQARHAIMMHVSPELLVQLVAEGQALPHPAHEEALARG